ncbi:protein pangolin, isoforms A/H/I/S isoform X1 [Coccinella septempunctata]|uniref:protein pangolin, isoforms A/H/I/S isoform X1 n=1 Tax=Coccinella septempunctata TaxID=41139 RepID=UPI001D099B53|nr:protein pangolin, isoforms A/H/I/S isoform X1 [Coccinella septempunctata]
MPHVSSSGGDDLGSTDEVKVFKDEGDGEDEKRSSENLTEEKSSLIDLTESEEKSGVSYSANKNVSRPDHSPVFGKVEPGAHTSSFNMGYLVGPYGYPNGAGAIPVSMASKMGLGPAGHPGAALPFFCSNGDPLSQPPPAHMGIPPYQLDSKATGSMGEYGSPPPQQPQPLSPAEWRRLGPLLAATGLSRPPMYPFSTGQYPYPMLSPEMSQVAASWHTPSMYPLSPGSGFRSPYPTSLPIPSSGLSSDFYRFSPTGLIPPHAGLSPHPPHHLASHPAIVTAGPKQELPEMNHRQMDHQKNNMDKNNSETNGEKKKPHIKKPLNAFMLYMKEMRAKVVAECTLKESAAINQILGRRWHSLSREEQAKYYEKARQERQLHMQLYPGWSARDNYGYGTKKKKRKKERTPIESGGNSMKKCRARYGLDHQSQWCKPCRRKKKCIRYMESGDGNDGNQSDDNLGSCGSMGDAHTPPDDDAESLNRSMSSPGGLSALSSLTSPGGMILPSPSTSVASPSVSLASPYMLQSPLTPHEHMDVKLPPPLIHQQPPRNPVGTNPHDINNPLSVNQLTGQCVRNDSTDSNSKETTRSIISVT